MHVYDAKDVSITIGGVPWNDEGHIWGIGWEQRRTLADRFRGTPPGPGNRRERRRTAALARRAK